jgi:TolA-binding protein
MRCVRHAALVALLTAGLAATAAAQTHSNVTQSDIQRLQDSVYQAGSDVSQLRGRDATRSNQLQAELDEIREEVIYLKVKLRKEGNLARAEYSDVRDRIDDLRSRARGDATGAYAPPATGTATRQPATGATTSSSTPSTTGTPATRSSSTTPAATTTSANTVEVPAGTEMDVRLSNSLNSGTAQVEDRFEGTTLVDLSIDGRTTIPAGSVMRGVVTAVEPATRTNRTARMTISFDQLTVNGRAYPIRATVTQAIQGEGIRGEAGRVGVGAGVGAILGGILGGFKGALAGILIGGGGTIAATEGREIELPQGTVLRVRFDSPLQVPR